MDKFSYELDSDFCFIYFHTSVQVTCINNKRKPKLSVYHILFLIFYILKLYCLLVTIALLIGSVSYQNASILNPSFLKSLLLCIFLRVILYMQISHKSSHFHY